MTNGIDRREIVKAIIAYVGFVLLAILAFIVSGCSPHVYPSQAKSEHSTDTVIRVVTVHDSVAYEIPVETERVIVRDSVSHLENDYAKSDAVIDSLGFLHHSLESIPQKIYIPYDVFVHDTTVLVRHAETIVQEVERDLTWWQRTKMNLFWILLALIIIPVAYKLIKNRII